MIPLALASRSAGFEVRPRSKPIIDAGPPTPVTTTSTTSSHSGAGPGHASTAVQTSTIDHTITSTTVERCHGWRLISQPSTGPLTMTATIISVSSSPAVVGRATLAADQERVAPQQRRARWR